MTGWVQYKYAASYAPQVGGCEDAKVALMNQLTPFTVWWSTLPKFIFCCHYTLGLMTLTWNFFQSRAPYSADDDSGIQMIT